MKTRVLFFAFKRGYHVGWRRPEKIVDHVTVLRALLSTAFMLGRRGFVESVRSGELAASALLPALPMGDGEARLLSLFPPLPALVKRSKLGLSWATLPASHAIVVFANDCASKGGLPLLARAKDGGIGVFCRNGDGGRLLLDLREGGIACLPGEDCNSLPRAPTPILEKVEEYHNRIDRVTGAADLYRVSGWRPQAPLWLGLHGVESVVDEAEALAKILGELGLGAYRSRGWGFFSVEELKPHRLDEAILQNSIGWSTGYNLLLGSMLPGEWLDSSKSFAEHRAIVGLSGPPFNEYVLPFIKAMGPGGLVYAQSPPRHVVVDVETPAPGIRALLVFNPIVVRGVGGNT